MARLTVISAASVRVGRRVILKVTRGQPISGSGHLTFKCGNSGAVVLRNIELAQIRDCVIECDCGSFNETPRLIPLRTGYAPRFGELWPRPGINRGGSSDRRS